MQLTLHKTLNPAFLKVKPNRSNIDLFKAQLISLLNRINERESEEFHKNLISDFLKNTYYAPNHFINTKGCNDLVIYNSNNDNSTAGVLIEVKKPTNKTEMVSINNLNAKALQELMLYYLRERISHKNLEVKHLIVTNINEWFIFNATIFEQFFAQDKLLIQQFNDFEENRLAGNTTDFFYKNIAKQFIDKYIEKLDFTYLNLQTYQNTLRNGGKDDDKNLIKLFKVFSPEHLLKLPFANDSNSLDKRFYSELLHIIGLSETKQGSKKVIGRNKENERYAGSIIENAINELDSLDKINRLHNPYHFGNNKEEQLFNIALELTITWINRILFLKLLEAQLLTYHKGEKSYSFLNLNKIKGYDDLNSLFFQVLARKYEERNKDLQQAFEKVPYLNSSLFEVTELEHEMLLISNLKESNSIPLFAQTVIKDQQGKKKTGNMPTLAYLFEFLNAYDFSSEGSEAIQEENKTLINASVLGLIFEKINGYKDGSFFTPGFITMYMCHETIRKAVIQKFNDAASLCLKECKNTPLNPLSRGDFKIAASEDIALLAGGRGECELKSKNTPLNPLSTGDLDVADDGKVSKKCTIPYTESQYQQQLCNTKTPLLRGDGGVSKRREIIPYNPKLKELARQLRNNSTKSEIALWIALKGKFEGKYDFHRQKPLDNYIADFFCYELKLVIEVDGETHNWEETQQKDFKKECRFNELELNVLRFSDDDVLSNLDAVLDIIRLYIKGFEDGDLSEFRYEDTPLNPLSRGDFKIAANEDLALLAGGRGESELKSKNTPLNLLSRGDLNVLDGEVFKDLDDIYDKIGDGGYFTRQEANDIINSLKICDPAVGSGHFLVSALNEIIAIKSELKILQDRNGKRLKEYEVKVVNDELIVTDDDGDLFEYNPKSRESQRVQEALFHEKQTIIEHCLFGVDINPNSVKICRLRLWIELLKNAYYKNETELETLPNIDINIKCGNSLVSRFAIDADLRQALKGDWTIERYRHAVDTYRNATSKEQKREMEKLIADIKSDFRTVITKDDPKQKKLNKIKAELYQLNDQIDFFELSKKQQSENKKKGEKLLKEKQQLENEIEDIKSNKIFDNAFEWRFEFPEVLNDHGDFVGFDVVIGNPPYIRQEEIGMFKKYLQNHYTVFASGGDIFSYFYELSHNTLKRNGLFSFINNTFDKTTAGKLLREYVNNNFTLTQYIDFTDVVVFEEATTYPIILIAKKSSIKRIFNFLKFSKRNFNNKELMYNNTAYIEINQNQLNSLAWNFSHSTEQNLLAKIRNHKSLREKFGKCFYGIKTGLNEAFITSNNNIGSYSILKNVYDGKDLKKWATPSPFKRMIVFESGSTIKAFGKIGEDEAFQKMQETYPEIFHHLTPFKEKATKRFDKGEFWWELRNCAYYDLFEKSKIIFPNLQNTNKFSFDDTSIYLNAPAVFLPTNDKSLLAILNSKVVWYFLKSICVIRSGGYIEVKPQYFEQIPIPIIEENIKTELIKLVEIIINEKQNPSADTSYLEKQIDQLVYQLYDLTEEEIRIIENA